mgnify:CR=1 FL=1
MYSINCIRAGIALVAIAGRKRKTIIHCIVECRPGKRCIPGKKHFVVFPYLSVYTDNQQMAKRYLCGLMNIGADFTAWEPGNIPGPLSYPSAVLLEAACLFPAYRFFVFVNREGTYFPHLPENVTLVKAGQPLSRFAAAWQWRQFRLPALIKKYRISFCFCLSPVVCSRLTIPACLLIGDTGRLPLLKKQSAALQQKKIQLLVPSLFLKQQTAIAAAIDEGNIVVLLPQALPAVPKNELDADAVKEEYAAGKNYFLYTASLSQKETCISTLRAFSLFKKRQQSAWHLVILADDAPAAHEINTLLETYKYKNEVKLVVENGSRVRSRLIGAAYAVLHPAAWMGWGGGMAEAAYYGVPVLAGGKDALEAVAGDAVCYADRANPSELAGEIMHLYKNEQLHRQLALKISSVAALVQQPGNREQWQQLFQPA